MNSASRSISTALLAGPKANAASFLGRLALLRGQPPEEAHRPSLRLFLGELSFPFKLALRHWRKPIDIALADHPRTVILLPGFATAPSRMRYMARQLERAGHRVKRWGVGYNFGPTPEKFEQLSSRVCEVSERYGEPVVLVGWSLGGAFAREVAKRHPECVAKVVTMGTPFSHTPYSNNVWRAYQLITGHSVESPPVVTNLAAKPPVETVALWSPRDGVVSPRAARGLPGERDRERALRCTHMGFVDAREVILAILQELDEDLAG